MPAARRVKTIVVGHVLARVIAPAKIIALVNVTTHVVVQDQVATKKVGGG